MDMKKYLVIILMIVFVGRITAYIAWAKEVPPVISKNSRDYGTFRETLGRLMLWFEQSGILAEKDGSKGIYERFILNLENPKQYKVARHIRADCTLQSALLCQYYADIAEDAEWKARSDNLFSFPLTQLQDLSKESHTFGLLTWSNQHPDTYWTDDNSWNMVLLLKGYILTGEKEYLEKGLICAESLLRKKHLLIGGPFGAHWGGFRTMGMAYAYLITQDKRFLEHCREYVHHHLENKTWKRASLTPRFTNGSSGPTSSLLGTSLYYYATKEHNAKKLIDYLGDFLISSLGKEGELHTSWEWHQNVPLKDSKPYVDFVYGHNFACLAFYHAYLATNEEKYKDAFVRGLRFLCKIQTRCKYKHLNGAWQGSFDPTKWEYGGPAHFGNEGGANSIYSGWTHAPIGLAFVFALTGDSFIPTDIQLRDKRQEIEDVIKKTEEIFKDAELKLKAAVEKKRKKLIKKGQANARKQHNVAFGKKYYSIPPIRGGKYYDDSGIKLTDGLFIQNHFDELRTLNWLHKNDIAIIVDLERFVTISHISFSCLGGGYGGCEYPNSAEAYGSNDGEKLILLGDFNRYRKRFERRYDNRLLSASWYKADVKSEKQFKFVKIQIDHTGKSDLHIDEIRVIEKQ